MTVPASEEIVFRYTAVDRSGKQVRDVVRARDARSAARALVAEGLTPVSVAEEKTVVGGVKTRDLNAAERVAVLRQLALMVEAGVGLLEAMQTVASGITATRGRMKFEAAIVALKRGDPLAVAMETHVTGFPQYFYALLRVGEATGRLGEVLNDASEQLAYETKLRREFIGSLIYPAMLVAVGIAVVVFMTLFIVPRFSAIIGDDRSALTPISRFVFESADFAKANLLWIAGGLAGVVVAIIAAFASPPFRARAYDVAREVPVIGPILRARELGAWSRTLGFALKAGVGVLDGATLARRAAPPGEFARNLEGFERDLKGGVDVAESLSRHTGLSAMDLALIRAGQKSGTSPRMFLFVADNYDTLLRDRMRLLSALVQPLTILFVAVMVAILAIGVMLAMTSVYQTI